MASELGQLLVDEGIVAPADVERALARQREAGGALDTALLELGLVAEETLAPLLARAAGLPPAPPSAYRQVDARARRVFPAKVAERHGLAPFSLDGRELALVAAHPVDLGLLDEISFMLSLQLTAHVGVEWRVRSLIQRLYGSPLAPRLARLAEGAAGGAAGPGAEPAATPAPAPAAPPAEAPTPRPPPLQAFGRDGGEQAEPLAAALAQAAEAFDLDWEVDQAKGSAAAPAPPASAASPAPTAEPAPPEAPAPAPTAAAEPAPEPQAALGPPGDRSAPPHWTLEQARQHLAAATTRDEVVLVALRYARDFFDFSAAFAVARDAVVGHDALGEEEGLRDVCRTVAFYATEPGVFANALQSRAPYLGPVTPDATGNVALLDGLGREAPRTSLVYPVVVRDRAVCILYADNGGAPVSGRRLGDLFLLLSVLGSSLERIILSKKARPAAPRPRAQAVFFAPVALDDQPAETGTWAASEPALRTPPPVPAQAVRPEEPAGEAWRDSRQIDAVTELPEDAAVPLLAVEEPLRLGLGADAGFMAPEEIAEAVDVPLTEEAPPPVEAIVAVEAIEAIEAIEAVEIVEPVELAGAAAAANQGAMAGSAEPLGLFGVPAEPASQPPPGPGTLAATATDWAWPAPEPELAEPLLAPELPESAEPPEPLGTPVGGPLPGDVSLWSEPEPPAPVEAMSPAALPSEARLPEPHEEQPVAERPAVEQPVAEHTAAGHPVVEQPAVEQPAVEQPAVEQPTVEQPTAVEWAEAELQPAAVEPSGAPGSASAAPVDQHLESFVEATPLEPVAAVAEPAVAGPVAAEPAVAEPFAEAPLAAEPPVEAPPAEEQPAATQPSIPLPSMEPPAAALWSSEPQPLEAWPVDASAGPLDLPPPEPAALPEPSVSVALDLADEPPQVDPSISISIELPQRRDLAGRGPSPLALAEGPSEPEIPPLEVAPVAAPAPEAVEPGLWSAEPPTYVVPPVSGLAASLADLAEDPLPVETPPAEDRAGAPERIPAGLEPAPFAHLEDSVRPHGAAAAAAAAVLAMPDGTAGEPPRALPPAPAPEEEVSAPFTPELTLEKPLSRPGEGPRGAAGLVDDYLASPRGSEARAALLALLGQRADEVAPILCDRLPGPLDVGPDALARVPAASQGPVLAAVATLGQAAVRPLLKLLSDAAPERRRAAAALLGLVGDPAVLAPLAERSLDTDPAVAETARQGLAAHRLEAALKGPLEKLRRALLSGLADRSAAAARTIGALRDAESIPLLIQALEGSDAVTAGATADALAAITMQRLGPTPRAWLLWWKQNRGHPRRDWLFGALTSGDRELRLQAAAELREAAPSPVTYSADMPEAERLEAARAWAAWFERHGYRA